MFQLLLLKPGRIALCLTACSVCIKPPTSLIKILITDAAYFIAGGKEFSFSEPCLFFGVAGVIVMRSFLVCFLSLEEFFWGGGGIQFLRQNFMCS